MALAGVQVCRAWICTRTTTQWMRITSSHCIMPERGRAPAYASGQSGRAPSAECTARTSRMQFETDTSENSQLCRCRQAGAGDQEPGQRRARVNLERGYRRRRGRGAPTRHKNNNIDIDVSERGIGARKGKDCATTVESCGPGRDCNRMKAPHWTRLLLLSRNSCRSSSFVLVSGPLCAAWPRLFW